MIITQIFLLRSRSFSLSGKHLHTGLATRAHLSTVRFSAVGNCVIRIKQNRPRTNYFREAVRAYACAGREARPLDCITRFFGSFDVYQRRDCPHNCVLINNVVCISGILCMISILLANRRKPQTAPLAFICSNCENRELYRITSEGKLEQSFRATKKPS